MILLKSSSGQPWNHWPKQLAYFSNLFFCFLFPTQRCSGLVRSSHPHSFHCSHSVWADWPDLPHLAGDDCSNLGQCCGPVLAAFPLWLHHQDQKAALPPRAWLGTPRVCTLQCAGEMFTRHYHKTWHLLYHLLRLFLAATSVETANKMLVKTGSASVDF